MTADDDTVEQGAAPPAVPAAAQGEAKPQAGAEGQVSPAGMGRSLSLIERVVITSSTKPAEDFYKGEDKQAIQDTSYPDLRDEYPMLCFCSPDDPANPPCRLRPSGHRGRIPVWRKWLWAFPMFGWFALKYMKVGFMKKFYTDDYPKASLGIIAFSSVLSVLVDAFTDPRMAIWTDNLQSRWGRRRPFIFASAFFVPVVFLMGWMPQIVGPGTAASVWFGVWHIMFKLADTMFLIPFVAWGAQLTPIYKEKTTIWQWKELFGNAGIFFGMAVFPLIFVNEECSSTPDTGCLQLPFLSVFFGAIFSFSCLLLFYHGKEPKRAYKAIEMQEKQKKSFTEDDTIPMLISTFLNQPFRCLLVSVMAKAVGQDIPFNVLPFMTSWVLGQKCFGSSFFAILILVNLVMGLLSVPLWTCLARFTSKYKAYCGFNIALLLTTLAFVFLGYDDGTCSMSYLTLGLTALFGAAYGGSFLLSDVVCDIIDYDELLTGGKRREASYLMAIEFIPKFMSIPGECVPFLLMAMYDYARPLPDGYRPECGAAHHPGSSPDEFCAAFYGNASATGPAICGDYPCAQLAANGVTFVCNLSSNECGIKQNEKVRMVLVICFSIVPCVCVICGLVALYLYPKAARSEAKQEELVAAITKIRRGQDVDDPWRPGCKISPATPSTESTGPLSYFWPSEIKGVVTNSAVGQQGVNYQTLFLKPVVWSVVFAGLIPLGGVVVGLGLEDLGDDLGASVSPLGLMLIGIGLLGIWFNGMRLRAAIEVRKQEMPIDAFVTQFNRVRTFVGEPPLEVQPETSPQ